MVEEVWKYVEDNLESVGVMYLSSFEAKVRIWYFLNGLMRWVK